MSSDMVGLGLIFGLDSFHCTSCEFSSIMAKGFKTFPIQMAVIIIFYSYTRIVQCIHTYSDWNF